MQLKSSNVAIKEFQTSRTHVDKCSETYKESQRIEKNLANLQTVLKGSKTFTLETVKKINKSREPQKRELDLKTKSKLEQEADHLKLNKQEQLYYVVYVLAVLLSFGLFLAQYMQMEDSSSNSPQPR